MDLSRAQEFTAYLPNEGLFRSSTDFGSTVYRRIGNRIEQFDMKSLLTPQEQSAARNMGGIAQIAKEKLSQMGVNWDSLPAYNIGDVGTAARKTGVDAGPIWGTSPNQISSVQELLKSAPSQGSRSLQFNTPTDVATAQTQLTEAQARPQATQPQIKGATYEQTSEINPETFGISRSYVESVGEGNVVGHQGKEYIVTPGGNLRLKGAPQVENNITAITNAVNDLAYNIAESAITSGKTLDPNADYSLVDFTSFLDQAKTAVSPYYQSKISSLIDSFKQNMTSLGADLSAFETKTQKEAEQTRLTTGETMAERGLAFSSARQTAEQQQAENLATSLSEGRRQTAEKAQLGLGELESKIGTTGARTALTTPSIGGRQLTLGTTSIYGDINIGSRQDADYFFKRLDRNNTLEAMGMSPSR